MSSHLFSDWSCQLKQLANQDGHRAFVALVGEQEWAENILEQALELLKPTQLLRYSELEKTSQEILNRQNYRYHLGGESDCIIFDTNALNIDAFAALSGTLVSGGILFLLISPQQFHHRNNEVSIDFFSQRFYQKLQHHQCYIVEQNTQLVTLPKVSIVNDNVIEKTKNNFSYGCVTQEQAIAVNSICKVAKGHRNRPLVLTADRGRGKSSALALACLELLATSLQPINIVVTAPHHQALAVFFSQLAKNDLWLSTSRNKYVHSNGSIEFVAIDELVANKPKLHLLLIDEAAGIPVYLLNVIAQHYHRLVFASTIHGYEGAGRSFSLKFQQQLLEISPQRQLLHIHQAIRWQKHDPLEDFVFNTCLLNSQLPELTFCASELAHIASTVSFEKLSQKALFKNEELLSQVFAILVTAHYQTTPSDLSLLLNNPKVSVLVLFYRKTPIAVTLLMSEGEDDVDIEAVKESKIRARDHFIPQSLLTHCGFESSFEYRYLRIMRIAVHPSLQHKGLGRYFLQQITAYAKREQVDVLGTSFGANQFLISFWKNNDFKLARIGLNKHKASGEHSALMVSAISDKGMTFIAQVEHECYQHFVHLLSDELKTLNSELVALILRSQPKALLPILTAHDLASIQHFASKQRQYSCCVTALHKWLLRHITTNNNSEVMPLVSKILQKRSISDVCQQYQFSGKKACVNYLASYISDQIYS